MAAEFKSYDFRSTFRQKKLNSAKVIIVGIDQDSIERLGRWPWPRTFISEAVTKLREYGVKVTGLSVLYSESESSDGLVAIREIRQKIEADPKALEDKKIIDIHNSLLDAEQYLNNDGILSDAIGAAKNVVLPMMFSLEKTIAESKGKIPEFLETNSFKASFKDTYHSALSVLPPIEEFAFKATALGHINVLTSGDGVVRKEPILIYYKERLFPSFALQLALKYMDYDIRDAKVGKSLQINKIKIPIDAKNEVFISYNGKYKTFPYYSFLDLMNDKVTAANFRDKIVIIGVVAPGIGSLVSTPVQSNFPAVEITANMVENILNNNHIVRPGWFKYLEIVLLVLFGIFISVVIPHVRAGLSAAITIAIFIIISAAGIFLFSYYGYWLKVSYPMILLFIGYAVIVSKRFLLTERKTEEMAADSIETNKMLGLSFQGQGMLDMAFEKFRKTPVEDESVKELLYNLGLDFERKRMFNKAIAVYEHILGDGEYKDLEEKIKRLKTASETVILGSTRKDATLMIESAETKPTLGRYEVLKELGRGAMGIVYLGKDPKINRDMAIKTLKYEEIDEDQIDEIKQRFFKEAEAAGKLSHPNIVKIYDVGDDNGIAYMAMELLSGGDLTGFCQPATRLPFGEVLRIVAGVADALDYAHTYGVVHRDIKPANIMLLENKEIRVTDFGIARVMQSSNTQTGMVMGTPSYMSPEQIAGRKVDGRSDLFSLGVVFYELLTGDRPFKGDSIATLMYNITTTAPASVKELDPRIPNCIAQIINKTLGKKPEERYQSGKSFIEDLNKCKKMIIAKQRANAPAPPKQ
ncbi:MAG: serine/threonine-protein kinase [Nitrospirae bacterium YQR-1]